jgi:hypothetical protein
MLSPPPTRGVRAPGNGRVSVQDREQNICIVDCTLNTASLRELKFVIAKINQRERITSVH